LFTDNVGAPGKWNDKDYVAEAVNHQPDHLALLPDQIGACSIADGAGLLMLNEAAEGAGVDVTRLMAREMDVMRRLVGNAMSNANVRAAINTALKEHIKTGYPMVVDVYPNFFIYESDGTDGPLDPIRVKLYKQEYTMKKDQVTIDESAPVEVVRVTEYRTAEDGKFVGNMNPNHDKDGKFSSGGGGGGGSFGKLLYKGATGSPSAVYKKAKKQKPKEVPDVTSLLKPFRPVGNEACIEEESSMDRKVVIDGLIANEGTGWEEADREDLESLGDEVLNKMAFGKKKKKKPDEELDEEPVENKKAPTAQEYVNSAPPEIRDLLTNGLAVHDAEKGKCIDQIVANKGNRFTKEFLATKGLSELQGLAALAGVQAQPSSQAPAMFFGGQATPAAAPVANAAAEEPLIIPVMNFERK
jgi:hypothetical protein